MVRKVDFRLTGTRTDRRKEQETIKDGKQDGTWTWWDEDENITEIKTYKDGVLVQ